MRIEGQGVGERLGWCPREVRKAKHIAYPCEIPRSGHNGPCANSKVPFSMDTRRSWEAQHGPGGRDPQPDYYLFPPAAQEPSQGYGIATGDPRSLSDSFPAQGGLSEQDDDRIAPGHSRNFSAPTSVDVNAPVTDARRALIASHLDNRPDPGPGDPRRLAQEAGPPVTSLGNVLGGVDGIISVSADPLNPHSARGRERHWNFQDEEPPPPSSPPPGPPGARVAPAPVEDISGSLPEPELPGEPLDDEVVAPPVWQAVYIHGEDASLRTRLANAFITRGFHKQDLDVEEFDPALALRYFSVPGVTRQRMVYCGEFDSEVSATVHRTGGTVIVVVSHDKIDSEHPPADIRVTDGGGLSIEDKVSSILSYIDWS
jgi:hypothetical protein